MNQDDSFNHPAMYNANWNRPIYFDSPKQVIGSFHVCDICGKIPTEIFSGVGFSCLNYCQTCRPNAYTPKSIFAKFLWWLDCNIGEPLWPEAPTIKNGDVVTYSHLNKHHSGEPTAYGGVTGIVEDLGEDGGFVIHAETCILACSGLGKHKSILLEKDGITFRHYFNHK